MFFYVCTHCACFYVTRTQCWYKTKVICGLESGNMTWIEVCYYPECWSNWQSRVFVIISSNNTRNAPQPVISWTKPSNITSLPFNQRPWMWVIIYAHMSYFSSRASTLTLTYELDLWDILKMYLHTKEVSRSRLSKVSMNRTDSMWLNMLSHCGW